MTRLSLSRIKARVAKLAKVIEAPSDAVPTFGYSDHFGRPHVEVDSAGYHFVVAERGEELERHTFAEIDELLCTIFATVTFELSVNYELAHRVENQDSRRVTFRHQIELLTQLSSQWASRQKQKHKQILRKHPFDDQAMVRVSFHVDLRKSGLSAELAWKKAVTRYPLPKGKKRGR